MYGVRRLNLEGNFLGDAGAEALADAIKGCDTLVELDLLHNNFSKAAMRELRDAAPGRLKLHLEYEAGGGEKEDRWMAESERTVSKAARASVGERVLIAE